MTLLMNSCNKCLKENILRKEGTIEEKVEDLLQGKEIADLDKNREDNIVEIEPERDNSITVIIVEQEINIIKNI